VIRPASRDLLGLDDAHPCAAPTGLDEAPTLAALVHWLGSRDAAVTFRSVPPSHAARDLVDGPRHLPTTVPDPNCFERAALFLAVAELIDPTSPRKLP
jgi:hypothetical protein